MVPRIHTVLLRLSLAVPIGAMACAGSRAPSAPSPPEEATPAPVGEPVRRVLWSSFDGARFLSKTQGGTVLWTGSGLLVWGGDPGLTRDPVQGGIYSVEQGTWTQLHQAPASLYEHASAWSGSQLFVFSGRIHIPPPKGFQADPVENVGLVWDEKHGWRQLPPAPIQPRENAFAAWTGKAMLVFGGRVAFNCYADGALLDPKIGWTAIPAAPSMSCPSYAVWTGDGLYAFSENTCGYFAIKTGTWRNVSCKGISEFSLANRRGATALWTGSEVLIWGGQEPLGDGTYGRRPQKGDGARYDPKTDQWAPIPAAKVARSEHGSAWTGSELIVVAGFDHHSWTEVSTVSAYKLSTNSWRELSATPSTIQGSTFAAWTGDKVIAWCPATNSGALYDPTSE